MDGPEFNELECRGMVSITTSHNEQIEMQHTETGQRWHFNRADLDEVIGMLTTFRLMLEMEESHPPEAGQ